MWWWEAENTLEHLQCATTVELLNSFFGWPCPIMSHGIVEFQQVFFLWVQSLRIVQNGCLNKKHFLYENSHISSFNGNTA